MTKTEVRRVARQAARAWFNLDPRLPGYNRPGPEQQAFRRAMVRRLAGHLEAFFNRAVTFGSRERKLR